MNKREILKHVDHTLLKATSDWGAILTLCDEAEDECPHFLNGKDYIHKGFKDPCTQQGTEEELMNVYRKTRDDIIKWIDNIFGPEA